MRKLFSVAAIVVAAGLIGLTGCGGAGASTPDGAMKEMMTQMNAMCDILEKSKTADEAKPKLEAITKKVQDLKPVLDKATDAQKKELAKKYEAEMMKTVFRLMAAGAELEKKDPGGMKKLDDVMKKMEPK